MSLLKGSDAEYKEPMRTRLPVMVQRSGRHYSWDSRFFHSFWVVDENMG